MTKNFGITASALTNTNRVVSASDDTWGSIRVNSFFRFSKDNVFYQVGAVKPIMLIYDFSLDGQNLVIDRNVGVDLFHADCLTITYKEFEIASIVSISNKGSGYKIGDVLVPNGGQFVKDPQTGYHQSASFKVSNVNDDGGVEAITEVNSGRYIVAPDATSQFSGGFGQGFTGLLDVKPINQRTMVERSINAVEIQGAKTVIKIDPKLPDGVIEGKISCEKWEILLTSNYVGQSVIGATYEIGRDFTPAVNLPLLSANPTNVSASYNLAMNLIDRKLLELQQQIDKLGK